jgi:uncharacterized protein with PIN domain
LSFALYLDENVSSLLAEMLAQMGYDVVTTQAVGRRSAPDEDQVAFAAANRRAILTHDREDYRRIASEWATAGRTHSGIVLMERARAPQLRAWVLEMFELYPNGIDDLFLILPFGN